MEYPFIFPIHKDTLFSGSILRNIVAENPSADEASIWNAAKAAQVHDEIMALRGGYNYVLGSGGIGLSEGQKQRLCLARAFYKKPPLLLLDECTSNLDKRSERLVLDYICSLSCTRILITHEESVYSRADRVLRIEGGKVEEISVPKARAVQKKADIAND